MRGLFDSLLIGEVTKDAYPSSSLEIINGGSIIGIAILALHGAGHILLRSLFRFYKCLVVQFFIKAVFKMMEHHHFIGRGHLLFITVDVLRGKPFWFFREKRIQIQHFGDLRFYVPSPEVLFCPASFAQIVVAIGFQTAQ